MALELQDINYFNSGIAENTKFWQRFKQKPNFSGSSFLDVGCGHGRLCIDIAELGAAKVVGIDIDSARIKFAQDNLHTNYSHFSENVLFKEIDLELYDNQLKFDYIVSKDSFEHILDLNSTLYEMSKRLKKGGQIYIGFAPLYKSFFGDHKRLEAIIPWGHLIFPESTLLKRASKKRGQKIKSVEQLGLNKMSLKQYRKLFQRENLSIVYFKVNCSNNPILRIFSLLRKIPGLEDFFSHNVYCILQKN